MTTTTRTAQTDDSLKIPDGTPEEIAAVWLDEPRVPNFDPTLGVTVSSKQRGIPKNRIVAIGDSLTHGFQSGAIFNTDLSYPAIIAHELGWSEGYRYPRYGGPGGLPFNVELLLRHLEERFGNHLSLWELPMALFAARSFLDGLEDYWERGPGASLPSTAGYNHDLSVYGWDLRDALSRTARLCESGIHEPRDDVVIQTIENDGYRAALRVYPSSEQDRDKTLFDVARALGEECDEETDCGIETLVVFLGANNALPAVTNLRVAWSDEDFADLRAKSSYTVWRPEHFAQEFAEIVEKVRQIKARHVIWCTVPHVTIPPIARGVGRKMAIGSQYFPYYARPWVSDAEFDSARDPHITGAQARSIDLAVDAYNASIEGMVRRAREEQLDWFLLDTAGLLDRLAARRYIEDPNARPNWWTPYPLPAALSALQPVPDSRFLTSDGKGGRATGGLFSLDGVHPTTIGYGLIAQEMINIMRMAGVEFRHGNAVLRTDPVMVDFARLLRRDTLVQHPPQNISSTLEVIGWADETLGWVRRGLGWRIG
jgi:hypothetical protein